MLLIEKIDIPTKMLWYITVWTSTCYQSDYRSYLNCMVLKRELALCSGITMSRIPQSLDYHIIKLWHLDSISKSQDTLDVKPRQKWLSAWRCYTTHEHGKKNTLLHSWEKHCYTHGKNNVTLASHGTMPH